MHNDTTSWKNTGQRKEEMPNLFKIRWDVALGRYVPDPEGKYLGYFVRGQGTTIEKYAPPEMETPTPKLIFGTPTLGVVDNSEEE